VPEALVIDVAAVEVWRRWWDAEVGIGRVTASDAPIRVEDLLLFRSGCQWGLLARCRLGLTSS
jgi:hypothetical protein